LLHDNNIVIAFTTVHLIEVITKNVIAYPYNKMDQTLLLGHLTVLDKVKPLQCRDCQDVLIVPDFKKSEKIWC